MRKTGLFWLIIIAMLAVSCKDKELIEQNQKLREQVSELKSKVNLYVNGYKNMEFLANQMKDIKARIITNYGNIELSFRPDKAPLHCFNFITRAESGYYNNTLFHRVIPGFMIQGGDPNTKGNDKRTYGSGGPIVNIPHEFNDLSHDRGVLSMARPGDVSLGAGSQFFITHAPAPGLDHQYTVFGKVTSGMDVVDKIATAKRDSRDIPLEPIRIKTIEVYR